MRNMGLIIACFGTGYSLQAILTFDSLAQGWDAFGLAHGYALVDGRLLGIKSGNLRAIRRGQFAAGYELRLIDINDHEHIAFGTTVAQHPWACYSNSHAKLRLVEWHADGRVGYGNAQENWALDRLTGLAFKANR